jgi:RsiW-degrading membrane proteinase PrsW (M82 family)
VQRRTLWLFAGIVGVGLVLFGCGGGLLALVWMLAGETAPTASETLPVAGMIGWGLGFGPPLAFHGWAGWRARPSRAFRPSRVWLLWLTWMLLVGVGAAVSLASWLPAWLLPPVHVLTMSFPPFILLWTVGGALGDKGGSWREVVVTMVSGGSLGLGLSLVGEALVGFALVVAMTVVTLLTAGGQEHILALVKDLQSPGWLMDFTNLAKLLLSPVVAVSLFGLFSIPVPLIEEAFKTAAAGLVARWVRPRTARAFLWGVAGGAGFALAENLFNGALGGAEGWAVGAVSRLGATVMHCATGGLVGWGWGQLWSKRRPWYLIGSYVAAVVVHGIWNGITVVVALVSISVFVSEASGPWLVLANLGTSALLGSLGLLTVVLLFVLPAVSRRLAAAPERVHRVAGSVNLENTPRPTSSGSSTS